MFNMDADGKRKQVTHNQLSDLVEFLNEHRELAKGLTRGRRVKLQSLKNWQLCAKKLNNYKDGAFKDARGWSKYWCDWKYRVRRRALELKAAKNNKIKPDDLLPLSPMEETILSIIGDNAVDGVVIKTDPLGNQESDEDYQDNSEDIIQNQNDDADTSPTIKKRRLSSDRVSDIRDIAGPSTSRTKHNVTNRADLNGTDGADEATQFLRLEREKLDINKQMADSLHAIRADITRIADIMGHIKDIIANNRINL